MGKVDYSYHHKLEADGSTSGSFHKAEAPRDLVYSLRHIRMTQLIQWKNHAHNDDHVQVYQGPNKSRY